MRTANDALSANLYTLPPEAIHALLNQIKELACDIIELIDRKEHE